VVVGRVSMNKKKAKRNLQRIANEQPMCEKRPEPVTVPEPVIAPEPVAPKPVAAPVAPAPEPAKPMRWADMMSDDEDEPLPLPKPAVKVVAPKPVAPKPVAPVVEPVVEPTEAPAEKKRRTHRGGRSPQKRLEQELRRATSESTAAPSALAALPEAVLARVFEGVELRAVGAAAAAGRALRVSVWASPSFWSHLSSDLTVLSADGFRKWLFGLHGDWATPFTEYCATADATAALGEAAYLCGGLVKADNTGAFLRAATAATQRVTGGWDDATCAISAIAAKVAERPQIFGSATALLEAADALRERALLAKLAEDDTALDFDPFAEEPAAWAVDDDAPLPDLFEPKAEEEAADRLDLDFATSFLELLDA